MKSDILQACRNGAYLQNGLRNLSLTLRNLFFVESIFKIDSQNLLSIEHMFCYRECWNFEAFIYSFNMAIYGYSQYVN